MWHFVVYLGYLEPEQILSKLYPYSTSQIEKLMVKRGPSQALLEYYRGLQFQKILIKKILYTPVKYCLVIVFHEV